MIKNVLTHIGGIEAYGIFSICLFFLFFLGMLVWAFRLSRQHLDRMSGLPLDDERERARCRAEKSSIQSDLRHE
jgi:cytochrome c oxidase cbb3-type subunit 4